jgi:hypothetical protein
MYIKHKQFESFFLRKEKFVFVSWKKEFIRKNVIFNVINIYKLRLETRKVITEW